ncbi:MAG: DUF512 domain-containing protein [Bacillota bacterium]|nr:DUF512 domain-containing protein [Bacillota bacterium]
MKNEIIRVFPNSIAEELLIEAGDKLLTINNVEIKDIIDYKFLMADEYIVVEVEKKDGEVWELEIEKEYEEDLGVEFKNSILDNAKSCSNKCIFCFVDQLPKNMRKTVYFKDDDSRLSFLQGNFVTLTNMKDEDIDRIIKYRISPINVSVHTTNPELRIKMLNNKTAGNIYERLLKLKNADIVINCQIVLCPGINNGEELLKTVEDLFKLYPSVQNVAAVPVGVTSFRENLYKLNTYNKESAIKEIELIAPLQQKYIKKIGQPFVRLSDEFYILAEKEFPNDDFYGTFEQLEDGIGMIRFFNDNIGKGLKKLNKTGEGSFTFITGVLAYEEILKTAYMITEINASIKINVKKIINSFFGNTITVSGLITGGDITTQLLDNEKGDYIIIPSNMLKSGEDIFLDDLKVCDLEKQLGRKVLICDYSGENLIQIINENCK